MKIILILIFLFILLISSITTIKDNKDWHNKTYLSFNFQRNISLTNSMTPEEFVKTIFYNQIYIKMNVGSEKQEIPFNLYLQKYPLVLQTSHAKQGEVKGIYDQKKSTSYTPLGEESDFDWIELAKGILSKDIFYFNGTSSNIEFYLSIESNGGHISEGGQIGFKITNEYYEDINSSFVKYLKKLDLISSYDISILYDSSNIEDDNGKLYIGALPDEINEKRYNRDDYIKSASLDTDLWEMEFQKMYLGNESFDVSKNAYFYPEFGFISGSINFFNKLNNSGKWYEYFSSNKKCHSFKFSLDDFESDQIQKFTYDYTAYYCDKDVDVSDIINENITFKSAKIESEFILDIKELWLERNEFKYFLILKCWDYSTNYWVLGKPFFKKYHMVFNIDDKTLGFYKNVNFNYKDDNLDNNNGKKDNSIIYISIISGLVVISGVLVYFLIKLIRYLPRKKKANELLDDNFEYKEGETQDNLIVPEGDKDN